MTEDSVPDEIKHFIVNNIDSVGQLEALLLLRGNPDQEWSAEAVARRLYISEQMVVPMLLALGKNGLIDANGTPLSYRYQPKSDELGQMIDRLVEIYGKHLVPVTNLIHTKPRNRIQEFADAFKLRKED